MNRHTLTYPTVIPFPAVFTVVIIDGASEVGECSRRTRFGEPGTRETVTSSWTDITW